MDGLLWYLEKGGGLGKAMARYAERVGGRPALVLARPDEVDDVRVLAAEVGLAVEPGWFPPRHVLLVWESARVDQRQMTLGI